MRFFHFVFLTLFIVVSGLQMLHMNNRIYPWNPRSPFNCLHHPSKIKQYLTQALYKLTNFILPLFKPVLYAYATFILVPHVFCIKSVLEFAWKSLFQRMYPACFAYLILLSCKVWMIYGKYFPSFQHCRKLCSIIANLGCFRRILH